MRTNSPRRLQRRRRMAPMHAFQHALKLCANPHAALWDNPPFASVPAVSEVERLRVENTVLRARLDGTRLERDAALRQLRRP